MHPFDSAQGRLTPFLVKLSYYRRNKPGRVVVYYRLGIKTAISALGSAKRDMHIKAGRLVIIHKLIHLRSLA